MPRGEPSLTDLVRPGPSAVPGDAPRSAAPLPVGLTIDGIGVAAAPVDAVGVEPNGELEIPGADAVGWYRHGPAPGEPGSTVLAAHIAFNGRDGVFRHLADVEIGALIAVELDDGSVARYEVVDIAQYPKGELPVDDLFDRSGAPRLTLITCGGDFDPDVRSYDDNVVVGAAQLPAEPTSAETAA